MSLLPCGRHASRLYSPVHSPVQTHSSHMAAHPAPAPDDCHSRLLSAAYETFLEEGYRASVDRISARAGVSKQTLYNHFPSKAELFAAAIHVAMEAMLASLGDAGRNLNLRERLIDFGVRYRSKLLSPSGIGCYRAMVAEASHFPELAATFYRSGPQQTAARLAVALEEAMHRGELRRDDPEFAVTLLLSMLVGHERFHVLFSGEPAAEPDPAAVGRIVDCFLRAFAPEARSLAAPRKAL